MGRDHFALQQSELQLPLTVRLEDGQSLELQTITRSLPKQRVAGVASYEGKSVFVKFFYDEAKCLRHWQRDQEGVSYLIESGLPTAQMILATKSIEPVGYVIIFEYLTPIQSLYHAWKSAESDSKEVLMKSVLAAFVQQHTLGVCQTDPHLNNFVFYQDTLLTLDGGGVEKQSRPLNRKQSLQYLAEFSAQLYPHEVNILEAQIPSYIAARDWLNEDDDLPLFRQYYQKSAEKRVAKMLTKIYRNCSAFVEHVSVNRKLLLDRAFDSAEMITFLQNPESQLPEDKAAWLKDGNTCTVWKAVVNGVPLVVKRYNIKSFSHGVSRALRRTRASVSWENAHRLTISGIKTPRPVALVEVKKGPIQREAYFITEFQPGVSCREYFSAENQGGGGQEAMAAKVVLLLQRFFALKLSHGDLKASNLMIGDDDAVMIDLDAMKLHSSQSEFEKAKAKDITRLLKNWSGQSEVLAWFEKVGNV
jgi:tRNA A-37 threonylcarbamoyl transferase component Bud32